MKYIKAQVCLFIIGLSCHHNINGKIVLKLKTGFCQTAGSKIIQGLEEKIL